MAAEATGYLRFFLGDHHLNEQDLYPPKLVDSWSMNIVCHQHTRASRINVERMQEFSIRPVILTRDIFDAAISLHDHLHRESHDNPTFSVPTEFFDLPKEAQIDAIIDLALPWHFQFVAAWQRAEIDKLWLSYEEMVAQPEVTLERLLSFYGLPQDEKAISKAVASAFASGETRLNHGVQHRGRSSMNTEQVARIEAIARHFPGIDFSSIGLNRLA